MNVLFWLHICLFTKVNYKYSFENLAFCTSLSNFNFWIFTMTDLLC